MLLPIYSLHVLQANTLFLILHLHNTYNMIMTKNAPSRIIRLKDMTKAQTVSFDIAFTFSEMDSVATILSANAVHKMHLQGTLKPKDTQDWMLEAKIGATVIQDCVVTLDPVKTRIDSTITRLYSANHSFHDAASVSEMNPDEWIDPLCDEINLMDIAIETLALKLPDYPKKPNAVLDQSVFAAPGIPPMTNEDVKPFASLSELRDKLSKETD